MGEIRKAVWPRCPLGYSPLRGCALACALPYGLSNLARRFAIFSQVLRPGRRSAYLVKLALLGRGGDSPEERIFHSQSSLCPFLLPPLPADVFSSFLAVSSSHWETNWLGRSDQDACQKDQDSADNHLEGCGKQRRVHVFVPDP
jgi:hypothetical protein